MYPLIRPLLFRMDPERAHGVPLAALRLAAYKLPHAYHFRDQVLPRTHTDKIDRLTVARETREQHRRTRVVQEE